MKRAPWLILVLLIVLLAACQGQPYEKLQSFASITGLEQSHIGHMTIAHDKYQGAVTIASAADLQTLYTALNGVQYVKTRQQPTTSPGPGGLTLRIVSTVNKIVTVDSVAEGRLIINGVEYYTVAGDGRNTVVDSSLSQKALAIGDELHQRLVSVKNPKQVVPDYPDVPEVQIIIANQHLRPDVQRQIMATLKPGGSAKVPLPATGSSYAVEIVFPKAFNIKEIHPIKTTSEIWRIQMNSGFADWADTNGRNLLGFNLVPWSGFEGVPPKDKPLTVPIKVNIEGVKDKAGQPYPIEFTLNPS